MQIHALASSISDNFLFIVEDGADVLLIDPFDADQVISWVRERSPERVRILNTHWHPDHVGGNARVVEALGCEIIAPGHGSMVEIPADARVSEGDEVRVGDTTFTVRYAPGHTDDHIVLHTAGHLVSGDVYFVAGAGHCKAGGDVGEHFRTFAERLADIPDDTTFYAGHDYSESNLRFCLSVEPENQGAQQLLADIEGHRREDGPVLTTLGRERTYNPFHRSGDADLQAHLREKYAEQWQNAEGSDAERAFRVVRGLRDSW